MVQQIKERKIPTAVRPEVKFTVASLKRAVVAEDRRGKSGAVKLRILQTYNQEKPHPKLIVREKRLYDIKVEITADNFNWGLRRWNSPVGAHTFELKPETLYTVSKSSGHALEDMKASLNRGLQSLSNVEAGLQNQNFDFARQHLNEAWKHFGEAKGGLRVSKYLANPVVFIKAGGYDAVKNAFSELEAIFAKLNRSVPDRLVLSSYELHKMSAAEWTTNRAFFDAEAVSKLVQQASTKIYINPKRFGAISSQALEALEPVLLATKHNLNTLIKLGV